MKILKLKYFRYNSTQLKITKLLGEKKHNTELIKIQFNKIANIIYKYHTNNKKLLFVGFPEKLENSLKKTKHALIPKTVWFPGIFDNPNSLESAKQDKKTYKQLMKLKKKSDLTLSYNIFNMNNFVKENRNAKIPVLNFKERQDILDINLIKENEEHCIFVDKKKANDRIFFKLIKTTILKAKKTKRNKTYNVIKPFRNQSTIKTQNAHYIKQLKKIDASEFYRQFYFEPFRYKTLYKKYKPFFKRSNKFNKTKPRKY